MHLRLCPSTLRPRGSAGWVSSSRISFPSHLQSSRSSVPHRRASVRWFVSSTSHRGGRKKWTFKPKPNAESPDASTGAGNHPRETRDTRETPQPVQRSDLPGPGPVPKLPFMSPRGFSEHAEELRRALAEKKSEFRAPDGQSQREIEIQAWKDVEAKLRSVHRADGVANIPINPNLPFEGEVSFCPSNGGPIPSETCCAKSRLILWILSPMVSVLNWALHFPATSQFRVS